MHFIIFYFPLVLIQGIIFSNGKVEVITYRAPQMDVNINVQILYFLLNLRSISLALIINALPQL